MLLLKRYLQDVSGLFFQVELNVLISNPEILFSAFSKCYSLPFKLVHVAPQGTKVSFRPILVILDGEMKNQSMNYFNKHKNQEKNCWKMVEKQEISMQSPPPPKLIALKDNSDLGMKVLRHCSKNNIDCC